LRSYARGSLPSDGLAAGPRPGLLTLPYGTSTPWSPSISTAPNLVSLFSSRFSQSGSLFLDHQVGAIQRKRYSDTGSHGQWYCSSGCSSLHRSGNKSADILRVSWTFTNLFEPSLSILSVSVARHPLAYDNLLYLHSSAFEILPCMTILISKLPQAISDVQSPQLQAGRRRPMTVAREQRATEEGRWWRGSLL
jgi:hypothetical protein